MSEGTSIGMPAVSSFSFDATERDDRIAGGAAGPL